MYEWLQDYKNLTNEIDYLEYQLQREKRELRRWVQGDLYELKLNEKSIASGLEGKIAEIEYELAFKMNDQFEAKRIIQLFDGIDNQILFKKYVEGKSLEVAATELNYSTSHIRKLHADIVKRIKFIEMYHLCSLTK